MFQDEPNPTEVTRARSTSKQMIVCFFGKTGHVAIVSLEQCRTVNSELYTKICLPVVFQEIRKTHRRRRITLHHDNASSHTSAQTTAFLSTQNNDLMSHLPYSPDEEADSECFDNWFKHLILMGNILKNNKAIFNY